MSKWNSCTRTKEGLQSVNHHKGASGLVKITRNPFGGERMVIRKLQIRMHAKKQAESIYKGIFHNTQVRNDHSCPSTNIIPNSGK